MKKFAWLVLAAYCYVPASAQTIDTIRVMHYNLLQYGYANCMSLQTKNNYLADIFENTRPDILTVNEIAPNTATINSLRSACLTYNPAMTGATYANSTGSSIVNMLYYNEDVLGFLNHTTITGNVRDIDVYHLYHKPSASPADTTHLWFFVAHFKSSTGYEFDRSQAANDIISWLSDHPYVKNYMLCGDLNLYGSSEPAWQNLIGGSTWFYDPIGSPSGWVGSSFANVHTQSPSAGANACGSEGGMDNRFDFTLVSPSVLLGNRGVFYLQNTCKAYGNDGVSYNQALNCNTTTSVPLYVCTALRNASDHLPVVLDLAVGNLAQVSASEPTTPAAKIINNPATDELRVAMNHPDLNWSVFNAQGQRINSGNNGENSLIAIPLAGLPFGPYFLLVQTPKGSTLSAAFVKI